MINEKRVKEVLHLSEITRFSNIKVAGQHFPFVLHLSEITRFSNLKWCETIANNSFTLI